MHRWMAWAVGFVLLWSSSVVESRAEPRGKRASARTRNLKTPAFTPEAVNSPDWKGPEGWAILRAQILLARAHFSPGEIDGQKGANFQRALSALQQSRKLPMSGELNEDTWKALNADPAPAVNPLTLTEADVSQEFTPIPRDMMEQSKLPSLGFESVQEALGERFHISPALLARMNKGRSFGAGQEIYVPDIGVPLQGKAAKVIVSKAGTVTVLDAQGAVLAHYPASSGSEKDPLPVGTWKINGVARNPPFFYNPQLFWDAKPEHSKAKIAPGPNNPVGVVWIDMSKEHYGVHGTPQPGRVGHTQSHGCIRLTNWDAMELASLVGPGTPLVCTE